MIGCLKEHKEHKKVTTYRWMSDPNVYRYLGV
jgi:hypothetical protein